MTPVEQLTNGVSDLVPFLSVWVPMMITAVIVHKAIHYGRRVFMLTGGDYEPKRRALSPAQEAARQKRLAANRREAEIERLERETHVGPYAEGDPLK